MSPLQLLSNHSLFFSFFFLRWQSGSPQRRSAAALLEQLPFHLQRLPLAFFESLMALNFSIRSQRKGKSLDCALAASSPAVTGTQLVRKRLEGDDCRERVPEGEGGGGQRCLFVALVVLLCIGIVWMGEHKSLQLKAPASSQVQIGLGF